MKIKKLRLLLFFVSSLLFLVITPVSNASDQQLPIFLKINDYYVLYTDPISPFIDSNNKIVMPIRIFSELIGAGIAYDKKSCSAEIGFSGHKVRYTVGSDVAFFDGIPEKIPSITVLKKNSILVPISSVVNFFQISNTWDKENRLFIINDPRIKNIYMEAFEGAFIADDYLYNKIIPLSYNFCTIKDQTALQITAKNISGSVIPEFREDLHPLYIYKDGGWGTEPRSSTARHRVKINNNQVFKITDANTFDFKNIKVILVSGRILKYDIF